MNFDEYVEFTHEVAQYPMTIDDLDNILDQRDPEHIAQWLGLAYCIGKLNGEAGELAELQFKALRDESMFITMERREAMKKELGDVLWYVARIAYHLGIPLSEIAEQNAAKLRSRKERGVLLGSGDDR